MNKAAPIIAGITVKPPITGPQFPRSRLPIHAPTNPAIIDPIIPPGMLLFVKALPIKPITIAIMILIIMPIRFTILSDHFFLAYLNLNNRLSFETFMFLDNSLFYPLEQAL
jgi:hypothetical protein